MTGAQVPAQTGEALFVSQLAVIERVISFVSSRHHMPGVEADDFASHAKLKLIEDDYAILRKFQGRSSLRTYLTVVIERRAPAA
jgi:RNA polymerase sigma factor for flagellar operon FliA